MINDSAIEDALILEFARRWLPYGGASSGDVLVEFGMTPAGYLARLRRVLDAPVSRRLDPVTHARLKGFVDSHPLTPSR
ncbi:DUF3263 domain-containing protein [Nocardia sp. NPDC003963]